MVLNTRSDRFLLVLLVALVMMGVFLEFGGFSGSSEITGLLVNVKQGGACQYNDECERGLVCRGSNRVERDVTFSCNSRGGNNIQCDEPWDCALGFWCSIGRCVKGQQPPPQANAQSRKRGETCVNKRDYMLINECEPGFSCFDGHCLLQPIKQSTNIAQNLCAPTNIEMALKLLGKHTDKTQMIIGQRLCQRVPAYKKAHPEKTDVKDCIWPKEYEETHQGVLKEYLREELHFNVTSVSSNFDANTGLVSEERFNEFMYYVRNGIPVIIHIQSHYELVIGYNDEQQVLYINDPGVGLTLKVPYVEFKNRNSNWHANREGRKNKKGWDGRYLALWANTLQESVKTNELQKHRSMSGTRCSIPNPKAIFSEVLFTYTANRQGWISTTFTLKPGESKPRSRSDTFINDTKDGYGIWGTDGDECRIKSGRYKSILEFSKNCRLGNDDVNNHYDEFCKFCENKKGAHNDCFKNFDSWRY